MWILEVFEHCDKLNPLSLLCSFYLLMFVDHWCHILLFTVHPYAITLLDYFLPPPPSPPPGPPRSIQSLSLYFGPAIPTTKIKMVLLFYSFYNVKNIYTQFRQLESLVNISITSHITNVLFTRLFSTQHT